MVTLAVLARSELTEKEELELFDIAWKAVTGPEGLVEAAQEASKLPSKRPDSPSERSTQSYLEAVRRLEIFPHETIASPDPVDSSGGIGDNGTTNSDENKEGRK